MYNRHRQHLFKLNKEMEANLNYQLKKNSKKGGLSRQKLISINQSLSISLSALFADELMGKFHFGRAKRPLVKTT